ncbi:MULTISPECIES: hypothetical protein [unclassified Moraxella]|uniref:hypothetical protein n=1 Tax=unclassified Moraxella TaxID=2685852 RepID=UPI003AF9B42A
MVKLLIMLLMLLLVGWLLKTLLSVIWHKMHAFVGIEVGASRHAVLTPKALGYQQGMSVPHSLSRPQAQSQAVLPSKKIKQRYWRTRYGNIPSLVYLVGVDMEKIDRMPLSAVEWLVAINDRMANYLAWQQQSDPQTGTWLTEKQFVINRLINETLPQAVNQYDQLARFNPQALQQPIHGELNAEQVLINVLQAVHQQLGDLLDELSHQATQQLVTTYRYVKSRTM